MKIVLISVLAAWMLVAGAAASFGQSYQPSNVRQHDFDETTRFIFYSVLEGLYEDGLSNADVDQILLKKEGQSYFHFIYACPICTSTIWALQTYRARPTRFYGMKSSASTFGPGLTDKLHEQLYSEDAHQRLTAINALMQGWMTRRMDRLHLSDGERAALLDQLEKKRREGMDALESFRHYGHGPDFGVAKAAPAYVDLEECAVCNGAVGKVMKLPGDSTDAKPTP